jgi:hypothetical protein
MGRFSTAIPIQVSIHDTHIIALGQPGRTLGNFCTLTVEENAATLTRRRHFGLGSLAEIEKSERWRSPSAVVL